MMVGSPDGQVRVQSLEKLQIPQVKGYKDRAIFTMLDLVDVRSAGSIRYGDSVWLQLSVGPGDVTWEQGGVLGAKVREAPQLKALGLMDDDAIRNNVQAPAIVGYPIPVTAYLPKSRDEADLQVDEIQSRLRNKSAKILGKWTIRSAVYQRRKQKDNFVYNNDEVYLEQDWFYLGADSDAGIAVLRQLPPAVAGKDVKPGEYVVERRGAWKMRLLDSSSGSAGLSLAQQQMERLLLRAKSQIKQSQRMRAGQTKDGLEPWASKDTTRHVGTETSTDAGNSIFTSSQHSYAEALNERVLQLFAKEDATMIGIIKYKENEVYQALAAEAQERAGISPAAAHFRDRFKHVNVLMQMHKKNQEAQQDGISGHFQKLRADLYSNNNTESFIDDDGDSEDDDYSDSDDSVDQSSLPQQDTGTHSPELIKPSEDKTPPDPDRLFPTPKELQMLTPLDTKAALALYVQNRTAMAEMMDGYAELVDSQIIPALQSALSSRNRGALLETLDFIARASEFVCARRVQVFVAKLLHAVAASNVGDFVSFQKEFDDVVTELQGATNFIRFFRQKRATRKTKAK
ncbi:hypothetical protein BBJ29_008325 [Phytophthora kernoviae]|nr:hypothetical protein BBJ29_008325 [Phytophthora kernoviae]